MSADAGISIPGIIESSISLSDDRWAVGDPAFSTLVGWHGENNHYLVAASVNIPVGDYDAGRLSNVSLNRWAGDITLAGTWMIPQNNIELSCITTLPEGVLELPVPRRLTVIVAGPGDLCRFDKGTNPDAKLPLYCSGSLNPF